MKTLTKKDTQMINLNIYNAAKAVLNFRQQYGPDACENMPQEYFSIIDKSFGSVPSEAQIWDIEKLSWSL